MTGPASPQVVLGAGPLGRAVAEALVARGHPVRIVSRTGTGVPGAEAVAADLHDPAQAIAACAGAGAVFQCAAPPYHRWPDLFPGLQDNAIRAAARAGAVLVVAENLYGYGVAGTLHEGLPLVATTRKGRVRAAMSVRLAEAHGRGEVRVVAGRAADFFGPRVRVSVLGERVWPALLAGRRIGWAGDPDALHSVTFVPDFARALIRLSAEPAAWGRAWHVPSPPARSPRAILAAAAAAAGLPPPRLGRTPWLMLRAVGLMIPAAGEIVEMAYAYDAPQIMRDDAFRTAFGAAAGGGVADGTDGGTTGGATGWDAALAATLAWWRDEGAQDGSAQDGRDRASLPRMRDSPSGVMPR